MSILDSFKAGISSIGSKISSTWGGITGAVQTANEARPVISFASTITKGVSQKNQQRIGNIFNTAVETGSQLLSNITNSLISRLTNNIDPNARELMRAQRTVLAAQAGAANAQAKAAKEGILANLLSSFSPSASGGKTTALSTVILFSIAGGLAYLFFFRGK